MRLSPICLSLLLASPVAALAQENQAPPAQASPADQAAIDAALARVAQAYGGDALISLRTVAIKNKRRLAWPGQGQTGSLVEFADDRLHKHFDLQNLHGSVERWIKQNGNVYHTRYVVDPKGAHLVDYFDGTAQPSERGGYWQWFGGDYRSSDLLLAHFLTTQSPEITYAGQAYVDGHPVDLLSIQTSKEAPVATVYVSRKNGLIQRLLMQRDLGDVTLIFSSHERPESVTFAREIHVYLGDRMMEYVPRVNIATNLDVSTEIALDDDLVPPFDSPDMSEMTIDEIAPGLYFVGQDDYSLFARGPDGLIAANGDGGIRARYLALTAHMGEALPLTHVILTHQHSDHIAGAADAAALGATLVMPPETQKYLAREESLPETATIETLSRDDAVGPFTILTRPTGHSSENAFVYHAASGALFQEDHYHGLRTEGASRVQPTARELHAIIQTENLQVNWMLSSHARKAERWSVFDEAVRTGPTNLCPGDRPICSDIAG